MPVLRPTRRQLLTGTAAAAAGFGLSRRLRADTGSAERKFIFVQTLGGWDITSLFAPIFGSDYVEHAEGSTTGTAASLEWVSHPERPSVDAFLTKYASRTAFLNGIYIASIAHPSALRLMFTSGLDSTYACWATRIAAASAASPVLPHLVVGGAYFAGSYGVNVGRVGSSGQLQGLANGQILAMSDQAVSTPDVTRGSAVDDWLAASAERAAERATGDGRKTLLSAYGQALERGRRVKDMADQLDFSGTDEFSSELEIGVRALELGVARCVTVAHPTRDDQMAYDSHAINDRTTSPLLESLFQQLDQLQDTLAATESPSGASLADETVIVVLSEMARTPMYNTSDGRDHWPCTSAILIGPGVAGGRTYGAWDEEMYGQPVDLATGDASDDGEWLGPEHLGATLLAMAGVEETDLPVGPITGLLA